MAMIACRECGTSVSDAAPLCPACGVRKPGQKPLAVRLYQVVVFVAVMALVAWLSGKIG